MAALDKFFYSYTNDARSENVKTKFCKNAL